MTIDNYKNYKNEREVSVLEKKVLEFHSLSYTIDKDGKRFLDMEDFFLEVETIVVKFLAIKTRKSVVHRFSMPQSTQLNFTY